MSHAVQLPKAEAIRSPLLSANDADILVIAHRGSWKRAPENSLKALRDAIDLGVGMVEIDTRRASDGVFVVLHDKTLDRTTEASGPAAQRTSRELASLRLREGEGGEDAASTKEHLPLLIEFLQAARGRVLINVDTKFPSDLPEVARAVLEKDLGETVLVKCEIAGDPADLPGDHPAFGPLPFMPVVKSEPGRFAADLRALAPLAPFMVESQPASFEDLADGMEVAREMGMRIWLNTLDCSHMAGFSDTAALADMDAVWGRLLDLGVSAIQTDESAALLRFIEARGLKAVRL